MTTNAEKAIPQRRRTVHPPFRQEFGQEFTYDLERGLLHAVGEPRTPWVPGTVQIVEVRHDAALVMWGVRTRHGHTTRTCWLPIYHVLRVIDRAAEEGS
jgi:hypothetical protein